MNINLVIPQYLTQITTGICFGDPLWPTPGQSFSLPLPMGLNRGESYAPVEPLLDSGNHKEQFYYGAQKVRLLSSSLVELGEYGDCKQCGSENLSGDVGMMEGKARVRVKVRRARRAAVGTWGNHGEGGNAQRKWKGNGGGREGGTEGRKRRGTMWLLSQSTIAPRKEAEHV
ncbi:hypothetical protein K438DRAFT_1941916 [Mycena galopus ATCC 62051]|nr:hypothetical protein K438DRAFT_1941916 [Mycena galopus ATCC 62051]